MVHCRGLDGLATVTLDEYLPEGVAILSGGTACFAEQVGVFEHYALNLGKRARLCPVMDE